MYRDEPNYTSLSVTLDERCLYTLDKITTYLSRVRDEDVTRDEALEQLLLHTRGGAKLLSEVSNRWRDIRL